MFLHLFIVNKSGGLIYSTSFSPSSPPLNTNDSLRIGSTFHSLHAIASQASPLQSPNEGIETIEANPLTLKCLQTPTGIKFVVTAVSVQTSTMEEVLREVSAERGAKRRRPNNDHI